MANFVLATKLKFRFPYKGLVSVEDLWDLTPVQLDTVFKALKKEAKAFEEDSLLDTNETVDYVLKEKINIVKFIFDDKKAEEARQKATIENAKKRQRLMEILANKQDEALLNKSEEELLNMLAELK